MFRLSKLAARGAIVAIAITVAACVPSVNTTGNTNNDIVPPGGFDPSQPMKVALLTPSSASNQGAATLGQALAGAARMGGEMGSEALRASKLLLVPMRSNARGLLRVS